MCLLLFSLVFYVIPPLVPVIFDFVMNVLFETIAVLSLSSSRELLFFFLLSSFWDTPIQDFLNPTAQTELFLSHSENVKLWFGFYESWVIFSLLIAWSHTKTEGACRIPTLGKYWSFLFVSPNLGGLSPTSMLANNTRLLTISILANRTRARGWADFRGWAS